MHSSITENLMILLRVGAFNKYDGVKLSNMSLYKWRKLVIAAEKLGILHYIQKGVESLKEDKYLPQVVTDILSTKNKEIHSQSDNLYNYSNAKLYNVVTSNLYEGVVNEETSKENISEETLNVLDIIISNMDDMITKDIDVRGIICLGSYIRQNKNKIDYNKLSNWLTHIGLVQVASMEGSMLVDCMGFTHDELPFIKKHNKKARIALTHNIANAFDNHSFSTINRYSIAMTETLSWQFTKAISLITDIEE